MAQHCPVCGGPVSNRERSMLAENCPICLAREVMAPSDSSPISWDLGSRPPAENTLGPYRLLRKLGEGGMGAVYLAEDSRTSDKVAVKVLPKWNRNNEDARSRFRREARLAISLRHPNLVRGVEEGEDRGHPYIAMEYCEGETLQKRLERESRIPWQEAIRIAIPVAEALDYAHRNRLVHRDVKPSNILVTREGVPKLLDLGISKGMIENEASFQTRTGVVLGTPQYLSPEQARGEKRLGPGTDIFSLGATLYHLITGRAPFTAASLIEVVTQHLSADIPDPREARPDLPAPVAALLRKMLAKSPENRPRSCADLVRNFQGVLEGRAPGRRRLAMPAIAAAIVLFIAAIWISRPSPPPPEKPPPPPKPVVLPPLREPENPQGLVPGVEYEYYEGFWNNLPSFDSLKPVEVGTAHGFDLTQRRREDGFAFRFKGFLDVPADGLYRFWTASDDGSKLLIGTTEVVSNDGARALEERSGEIALMAGRHAITVTFFEREVREELSVFWEGPTFKRREIAPELIFRPPGKTPPPPPPPVSPGQEIPLPVEGLVAYWKFDEETGPTARDSSGSGNHGTWVKKPVPSTNTPPAGIVNPRSMEFDSAQGQHVKVQHSTSLSLTGSLTLAAWIRSTRRTPHQQGIIEKFSWLGVQARGGYILRLNATGNLSFGVVPADGGQMIWSARPLPLGVWSHVAGVYDAKTRVSRSYLNGTLVQEQGSIPPPVETDQPLMLGADYGPCRFHGMIDEARVYNRALSPLEIRQLSGRAVNSPPMTLDPKEAIDHLASVDPSRDMIKGRWTLEGKTLVSPLDGTENRLRLRPPPGDEYDVSMVAQRDEGTNCLALILSTAKSQFMVVIDGGDQGDRTSLWMIDGVADNGFNSTTHSGKLLPIGKPVTVRCSVRRNGVRLWIDDQMIFHWEGSPDRLSLNPAWGMPLRWQLGVGTSSSRFRITSLTVTPFGRFR